MAQRRMFSKKITETDAFLGMPATAQLLYFHLNMYADDDGFVGSPKTIMRMIGSNDDDIKVLVSKRFIIPFDSGVCVIKHWKIHNYIQKDRYSITTYLDEKKQLKEKENGSYSLKNKDKNDMDTECIQNVSKMDTQVRLGKDRKELEKGESSEPSSPPSPDKLQENKKEVSKFFSEYEEYLSKPEADYEVLEKCADHFQDKGYPLNEILEVYDKFYNYWTEPVSGGKTKWEKQLPKGFSLKGRLSTFFKKT